MKYLIVSPEYMANEEVIQSFKDDVRGHGGKLRVLRYESYKDIRVEGNEDGCGYWSVQLPVMGKIVDDEKLRTDDGAIMPDELFEI